MCAILLLVLVYWNEAHEWLYECHTSPFSSGLLEQIKETEHAYGLIMGHLNGYISVILLAFLLH